MSSNRTSGASRFRDALVRNRTRVDLNAESNASSIFGVPEAIQKWGSRRSLAMSPNRIGITSG